eukprot:COSAG02_NODE_291_length_25510_cov_9.433828_16_plen_66_part_00
MKMHDRVMFRLPGMYPEYPHTVVSTHSMIMLAHVRETSAARGGAEHRHALLAAARAAVAPALGDA